ncbi:myo-inositol-1(or 4)-monophosphatase [Desulfosarcina sp. BuS5]|uniref:inositol monophosphatase family protein n=1 Tax=Desulfosarcina sp. BuS5 TaxID=933262 RepID=UPI000686229E|nr:inositol monophosphatase family protein [Desulfosarcina sp. BuS5]WDN89796.1 myo-inositol-1(or 4)-monophosphatase [Desulfosarcina sp. BuS5]
MIEKAKKAAREAGKILLKHFGNVPQSAVRKKARNDFISFVDEKSEETIIKIIRSAFPDHAILAEEGGAFENDNPYRWIIDPLDGTTNYLHSIPVFAVSIALEYKNSLIAGVIYSPLSDEIFWASKGEGAFFNGRSISVSGTSILEESFIATGFPFKNKELLSDYLEVFKNIFQKCIGARRIGTAAIDLAYVAAGRFDGFWEIGLKPWDVAAGAIIIEEAGGIVTNFWGGFQYLNNPYIIASNGKIHKEMGEIIKQVFPSAPCADKFSK